MAWRRPAEVELVRIRLAVAYDGTDYHGFAPNAGVLTVGATLAEALGRVLGRPIELACAGRTDAGVHAWGQVVSFGAPAERLDLDRAGPVAREPPVRALNRRSWCAAPDVSRAGLRCPLLGDGARLPLHGGEPAGRRSVHPALGVARRAATRPAGAAVGLRPGHRPPRLLVVLPGRRSRRPGPPASLPCGGRRRPAGASSGDGILRFEIEANAFCHQMVRSLVGTLVDVGLGRRTPGEVTAMPSGQR